MKAKSVLLIVLACWFWGSPGRSADGEKHVSDVAIRIIHISPPNRIVLRIENPSDRSIRIWRESNSWGAGHWRVLVVRKGQVETLYQNPDQAFTRNIPGFDEIKADGYIDKTLDLDVGDWRSAGDRRPSLESGDLVIVVYDVPKALGWVGAPDTVRAHEMGVWYGVAVASTTLP